MSIPIQEIVFYLFSLVMIGAATGVITSRNPVYAALFLVLTFFSAAAIWMLLEAEFLSIVLIVVYVGAVMVLFLFVVMMLDINLSTLKEGFTSYLPVGMFVAFAMAAELLTVIWAKDRFGELSYAIPSAHPEGYSNTAEIGERLYRLYTQFLLPFEVAGIILLVAIVAAIALTLRKRPDVKVQIPAQQVRVRADERVRVVNMPSETDSGRGD
jgi:NADH-quinone oxidoreductase subunit J